MNDLEYHNKKNLIFFRKLILSISFSFLILYVSYLSIFSIFTDILSFAVLISLIASLLLCIFEFRINTNNYKKILYLKLITYFISFCMLRLYLDALDTLKPPVIPQAKMLIIAIFTWILLAIVTQNFFYGLFRFYRKTNASKTPNLILKLSYILTYIIILFLALNIDFNCSFKKLLESFAIVSGALTIAIGFYFKEVIINIMHGILLAINPPFEIGDVIEINNFTGFVEEYRWRTLKLRTFPGETVILPNHMFANTSVKNLTNIHNNKPSSFNGSVKISVNPDHDPGWIKSLLMDALHATTPLHDAEEFKVKIVFLLEYNEKGTKFLIIFDTTRLTLFGQRSEVLINIYQKFADAGVRLTAGELRSLLPTEQHFSLNITKDNNNPNQAMKKFDTSLKFRPDTTYFDQIPNEIVIQRCDLFKNISKEAVRCLTNILERRHFDDHVDIIKPNEFSGGIHLIRSGTVGISDNKDNPVAQLKTGHVFGEMCVIKKKSSSHRVYTLTHTTTLFFSAERLEKEIFNSFPELKHQLEIEIINRDKINTELKSKYAKKKQTKSTLDKVAKWFFAL